MGKQKVKKLTPKEKKQKRDELKVIMKKLEQIKDENKGKVENLTPITSLSQAKRRIKKEKVPIRNPDQSDESEKDDLPHAPRISIFSQANFQIDPSLIQPKPQLVPEKKAELSLQDKARKQLGQNMNFDNFLEKPMNKLPEQAESESQQLKQPSKYPDLAIPGGYFPVDRTTQMDSFRQQLPIMGKQQQIVQLIGSNLVVLICGETGSGKSTQLPQFLYEKNYNLFGMIAVTQPRRLAAIALAQRVSEQMNLTLGQTVGYQVRHQKVDNPETKIKFMTDGILLNEISSDLLLLKYSVVIIDQAHQRKINSDLLVGLLSKLILIRYKMSREGKCSPLRLVIMSATMRVDDFNNKMLFHDLPPIVKVQSRMFPVTIYFAKTTPADYIDESVKKCVKIHRTLPPGDVLVFLTGKEEILKMTSLLNIALQQASCNDERNKQQDQIEYQKVNEQDQDIPMEQASQPNFQILNLYSSLPLEQQKKVFQTSTSRRFIISTNISETSLTIPNIRYVIDSGHEKYRHFDKIWRWYIGWGSKAMAEQRAGRAGRVAHGYCYRLYSTAVYSNTMKDFPQPEITKIPLENVILQLKSVGIQDILRFPFPTSPDRAKTINSLNKLIELKAVEGPLHSTLSVKDQTKITQLGRVLSFIPLQPAYGKLLLIGRSRQVAKFMLYIVLSLTVETLIAHSFKTILMDKLDIEQEDDEDAIKKYSKLKEAKHNMVRKNIEQKRSRINDYKTKYSKYYTKGADVFVGMNIIGEYISQLMKAKGLQGNHFNLDSVTRKICLREGLIENSMKEIFRNGEQIIEIYETMTGETLDYKHYTHPDKEDADKLLDGILEVYFKNVAYLQQKAKYKMTEDSNIYLHPSSFLYSKPPMFIGYLDTFQTNRVYMKYPFKIRNYKLLATQGKINPVKQAVWDGRLYGIATGQYKTWTLPPFRLQIEDETKYFHIARLLLQGKILSQLSLLQSSYNSDPSIINPNNKTDQRVSKTVSIIKSLDLTSDQKFKAQMSTNHEFLLQILKLWTDKTKKVQKVCNTIVKRCRRSETGQI